MSSHKYAPPITMKTKTLDITPKEEQQPPMDAGTAMELYKKLMSASDDRYMREVIVNVPKHIFDVLEEVRKDYITRAPETPAELRSTSGFILHAIFFACEAHLDLVHSKESRIIDPNKEAVNKLTGATT